MNDEPVGQGSLVLPPVYVLTTLLESNRTGSAELSACRNTALRRWFKGQWWCTTCTTGIRFSAGTGWIHTREQLIPGRR